MKKIVAIMLFYSFTAYALNQAQPGIEKETLCIACHGQNGLSSNPEWPSLAGQHAGYLAKQLHDYKNGKTRPSAVMAPIVANLSDQDIIELAAFYSKKPIPEGLTPERYLKRGEALYRGGDFKQQITACIACHGPKGTGNAQAGFPVLAGQQVLYTIQQLQAFKEKTRSNDFNSIMRDISSRMSKKDMEAVAYYIQGLY